jgi:hypothetical protein
MGQRKSHRSHLPVEPIANETLGMESRFRVGQICVAKVYEKQGMYSEALVAYDHALEFSGGNSEALSLAGYVHAIAGDRP